MVRLKLKNNIILSKASSKSQFHYGSIKTILRMKAYFLLKTGSQFHYGSIKTKDGKIIGFTEQE